MNYARIRLGGHVKRFHTVQVHKEQSVAAHSWGVATILLAVCHPEDLSVELLTDALYHDVAEYDTGDVPAHVKWANPALAGELRSIEMGIENDLGIYPKCKNPSLLRAADLLELMWYCAEEISLGNKQVLDVFYKGMHALRKLIEGTLLGECNGQTLNNILLMTRKLTEKVAQ